MAQAADSVYYRRVEALCGARDTNSDRLMLARLLKRSAPKRLLLVEALDDPVGRLCKAGVEGSIPLVTTSAYSPDR
jgi:hypothetical protein